jgi:hypothetical protein
MTYLSKNGELLYTKDYTEILYPVSCKKVKRNLNLLQGVSAKMNPDEA